MPTRLAPRQLAHVALEVRAQRKLEAVKWVKSTLGISLAEAKALVDAVEAAPPPLAAADALAGLPGFVAAALDAGRHADAVAAAQAALEVGVTEAGLWVDGFSAGRASLPAAAGAPAAPTAGVAGVIPATEPFYFEEPPR